MLTAAIINLGLSRERFASTLGISRGYLSGLEHGKKLPSLDLAVRIDRLTHGAVPVASWVRVWSILIATSLPGVMSPSTRCDAMIFRVRLSFMRAPSRRSCSLKKGSQPKLGA